MRIRSLVVFLLLAATLQAATIATTDMIGRWHFLPEKSKGGQHFPPDTTLVVKQYGARMYFEYWANNRLFQKDEYRVDGKAEKLYKTANEEVYVDGHISRNQLRITTHHIMENEIGSQSFDDIDSWVLSKDGKSLTFLSADNRNMYFERTSDKPDAPAPAPAAAAPAPAPAPAPAAKKK